MDASPLGALRARRRLSVEEAAARARLDVEDVKRLEESRLWLFPTVTDGLAAALVYAAALGISEREARQLAGLPVRPRLLEAWSVRRWAAVVVFVVACAGLASFVARPDFLSPQADPPAPAPTVARAAPRPLPPRWEIRVDVYNGTRRGNAAAAVANRIAGLAYRIGDVGDAKRVDYRETRVYYPPGAEAIARRLARDMGIATAALPGGGGEPRRLVVIVGSSA